MVNGGIYTVKTKSDYNLIYPLRKIREEKEIYEKYFLTEQQIEKFTYLKGKKGFLELNLTGHLIIILRVQCHFQII